jgi:hypothetical protein
LKGRIRESLVTRRIADILVGVFPGWPHELADKNVGAPPNDSRMRPLLNRVAEIRCAGYRKKPDWCNGMA